VGQLRHLLLCLAVEVEDESDSNDSEVSHLLLEKLQTLNFPLNWYMQSYRLHFVSKSCSHRLQFCYHICAWNHVNCSWFHTKHAVVEFDFEQENMWQDVDPDNMSYEVRIFVLLAAVLENWTMHCFCWDSYNSGCQLLVYVATSSSRADSYCIAPLCMFSSHWCFWASGESREHLSFWTVLRVLVQQSMFWFWFLPYCLKYRSW
jgi:hypothetical protein